MPARGQARKQAAPKRSLWRWLVRLFVAVFLVGAGYALYLDLVIVSRFQGQKWELPAHVYARPLELYPGLEIVGSDLQWELDRLGYRRADSVTLPGQYRLSSGQLEVYTRGFAFWDGEDVAQHLALSLSGGRVTSMRAIGGGAVGLVRLEPMRIGGIYPDAIEDRLLLTFEQIPELVKETLLLVEDQDFYRHHGVSPRAIVRAAIANIRAGSTVQGGSTLTQQLVKNFYLSSEQTLVRKAREAVMAILLDLHFSKDEILTAYFNEIYFGQSGQRTVNGLGLASHHFYRQPVEELEPHQIALLIGMIKGPSQYDPWRNPERAQQRRDLVLGLMGQAGLISSEEVERYRARGLEVSEQPGRTLNPYPGYMRLVLDQLQRDYPADQLETGGLKIFTAFDPIAQREVESAVREQLASIESGYRIEAGQLQTAVIVTRIGSGEVVALLGDREPGFNGFNRAVEARRPIGSLIKPVLYLTALNRPSRYTLSTLIDDLPIDVPLPTGETWSPENYEKESHGPVPLYLALANSYNQAATRLGLDVGVESVLQTLTWLGVDHAMPAYPSMLLGAGDLTPLQVATAYHTLAADGFYTPLGVIRGVYTAEYEPLQRYARQVEQRIDPRAIHLLQYAMQVVMREGTGRRVYQQFPDSLRLAGKTGTTNDQRDSWFAGFGGTYLTVVWVGRDDNGRMPLTGATGALPIWQQLMLPLESQSLPFVRPSGVEYYWVEPTRQALSAEGCVGAVYLPFVAGSEPGQRSPCLPSRSVTDRLREFLGL